MPAVFLAPIIAAPAGHKSSVLVYLCRYYFVIMHCFISAVRHDNGFETPAKIVIGGW
jgi:hypothetical protein